MRDLQKLISPKSIAIIGASNNPDKIGFQILNNIKESGYSGNIFPVNSKGENILKLKCYINLSSIKKPIDLAIIVIPAPYVLDIIKECVLSKVSSIIVISAGFSETGSLGLQLEDQIKRICDKNNILLLGPNCLGLVNTEIKLNASFAALNPDHGNVSFISQSGAIISSLVDWSNSNLIGFSKIFSVGNKAQIDETELLELLYNDKKTSVILMYLEELNVSAKITDIFIKYSKTKPTIVFFGGKTKTGTKASSSHTGAIVTSYLATETYLKQAGVILASSIKELFLFAKIFSKYTYVSNNKVAIITNAGGPSIAACDSAESNNLKISQFSKKTTNKLSKIFGDSLLIKNPFDLLGDASPYDYKKTIEIINDDKDIGSILAIITKQSSTDVLKIIEKIKSIKYNKPLVVNIIGGDDLDVERLSIDKTTHIVFDYPEESITAISKLYLYNINKPELLKKVDPIISFDPSIAKEIFKRFRLPVLDYHYSKSFADILAFANKIEFPVVLKTGDRGVNHKSESGGVIVNIESEEELESAFKKLKGNVKIGKMIKGIELFLGAKRDKNVGTVLTFGAGGIYSEIDRDFSYRITPLNKKIARNMIMETKISKVLLGARGGRKYDLDELAEILVSTSNFLDQSDNISEIDFNPIIAYNKGYQIVDTRIIIDKDKNAK